MVSELMKIYYLSPDALFTSLCLVFLIQTQFPSQQCLRYDANQVIIFFSPVPFFAWFLARAVLCILQAEHVSFLSSRYKHIKPYVTRSVQFSLLGGFLPIWISFVSYMILDALLSIIMGLSSKAFFGLSSTQLVDKTKRSRNSFQMIKGMTCGAASPAFQWFSNDQR